MSSNYINWVSTSSNFLLAKKLNKLHRYPVSKHAYIFKINSNPVFYYKFLWLDYIKKINFIKKLYSSNSDLWYITNRYEYLGMLDNNAARANAKIFHFNSSGQLSSHYFNSVADLDYRIASMGIVNTGDFKSFHNNKDRYFFLINNERRDYSFVDELCAGILGKKVLCISVADSDALAINLSFYGLFGNNTPINSKLFFLHLFKRLSGKWSTIDSFKNEKNVIFKNRYYQNYLSGTEIYYNPGGFFFRPSSADEQYFNTWIDTGLAASRTYYKSNWYYDVHFDNVTGFYMTKKMHLFNNYFKRFRGNDAKTL